MLSITFVICGLVMATAGPLYAEGYTVTFDKNNSDAGSTDAVPTSISGIPSGMDLQAFGSFPAPPTRPGYIFGHWNTSADGLGNYFGPFISIFDSITVYAQWSAMPTYTLDYDGNGNTGGNAPVDPDSPYIENDTVTVLGNTGSLSKSGYNFAGWNTMADGSGTGYAAAATFGMPTANVRLYAQWNKVQQWDTKYKIIIKIYKLFRYLYNLWYK